MLWFKKKVKIDTIEFLRINRDIFDRYENHLYQNLLDLLAKNVLLQTMILRWQNYVIR